MDKTAWTTEVGTLDDSALATLKSDMDTKIGVFKTKEAELKVEAEAAEKTKLDAAFSGIETAKTDAQTAFEALEGQLEYWANAKKKSKTEKEWEENHYKYLELEGSYNDAKKKRDDTLATFNEANTAKIARDAKAERATAVENRKSAITQRTTDIGTKEGEVDSAKTAAGDDWATDSTYLAKKGELDALEAAQKQDLQLNLEQEAADAAAERESQKTAFDALETDLTTLNTEITTQEANLLVLTEKMANAQTNDEWS